MVELGSTEKFDLGRVLENRFGTGPIPNDPEKIVSALVEGSAFQYNGTFGLTGFLNIFLTAGESVADILNIITNSDVLDDYVRDNFLDAQEEKQAVEGLFGIIEEYENAVEYAQNEAESERQSFYELDTENSDLRSERRQLCNRNDELEKSNRELEQKVAALESELNDRYGLKDGVEL